MNTEIQWISTDERLPEARARVLVLLPRMGLFGAADSLELRECRVSSNRVNLVDMEGERLDWDLETAMWWALAPDWMEQPGWRVTP